MKNRFSIHSILSFFTILCLVYSPLFASSIETFYGTLEVDEPVLLELIESPAFQRLKHIHQYGVAYYTTYREEYTRYEHSLGVFALLRTKGCSLDEQIAGLLHDVSHTIFSHVGDWVFNKQNENTDYQTLTHCDFLERSGIGAILRKYGYQVESVQPKQEMFPALEQPLPTLCADRLDYNIQGAFYQGFLTHEEAVRLFQNIQFINGDWISSDYELLKKLVRYSIYMSQACWGSPSNYVQSMWLAEAILQGLEIGLLTMDDIRFGIDHDIWNRLLVSKDPLIQKNMHLVLYASNYLSLAPSPDEADLLIISKFRGIDPFVLVEGKKVRLTTTDPVLAKEFQAAKAKMAKGWAIKFQPQFHLVH